MFRYQKGEWGYIKKKKIMQIVFTIIMALVGIGIFLTGYFLYKKSNQNVFTVLAVLMVLPGAKFLVSFIVLFPFKSPNLEQYKKLKKAIPKNSKLFSDMVITSPLKVMDLDFIIVSNDHVIGVIGKENQDVSYIQDYLTKGVRNWSSQCIVKIYPSFDGLLRAVNKIQEKEINKEDEEKVIAYLNSLIV